MDTLLKSTSRTEPLLFVPMHTRKRELMINITFKLESTDRQTDLQLLERKSLWSRFRQRDMKSLWEWEAGQGAPFYSLLCFLRIIFLFTLNKWSLYFTCLCKALCRTGDLELLDSHQQSPVESNGVIYKSSRNHSSLFKWEAFRGTSTNLERIFSFPFLATVIVQSN